MIHRVKRQPVLHARSSHWHHERYRERRSDWNDRAALILACVGLAVLVAWKWLI